jgi:thioredoxin 1
MASPIASDTAANRFIVVCLCAEWCSSCREYGRTFNQVAREFAGVRFLWIDVEDQAALVDAIPAFGMDCAA